MRTRTFMVVEFCNSVIKFDAIDFRPRHVVITMVDVGVGRLNFDLDFDLFTSREVIERMHAYEFTLCTFSFGDGQRLVRTFGHLDTDRLLHDTLRDDNALFTKNIKDETIVRQLRLTLQSALIDKPRKCVCLRRLSRDTRKIIKNR